MVLGSAQLIASIRTQAPFPGLAVGLCRCGSIEDFSSSFVLGDELTKYNELPLRQSQLDDIFT